MTWNKRKILFVAGTVFVSYLCIYYWPKVAGAIGIAASAFSPLIMGGMIAYVLNLLMSFFERTLFGRKGTEPIVTWKRIIALLISIVVMVLIVAVVGYMVLPELWSCIQMLVKEVPGAIDSLIDKAQALADEHGIYIDTFLTDVDWKAMAEKGSAWLTNAAGGLAGRISSVASSLVSIFISFIFALYLLLGKDKLRLQYHMLLKHYVPEVHRTRIHYVVKIVNNSFHKFIVGQCTEAVILGVLCAVGMMIFGFPYATMVGAVIACTALIPVAGAYIGAAVGAILILTVSPIKALLFVVYLVVLQQLEGNLIYPRVVGASIGLPGLWVLAAITVGGNVAGIGGMLFAVPIAASIYTIIRNDVKSREAALAVRKEENDEEDDVSAND